MRKIWYRVLVCRRVFELRYLHGANDGQMQETEEARGVSQRATRKTQVQRLKKSDVGHGV